MQKCTFKVFSSSYINVMIFVKGKSEAFKVVQLFFLASRSYNLLVEINANFFFVLCTKVLK